MQHKMDLPEAQFNAQVSAYWSWVARRQELGYWNMPGWIEHQNLNTNRSSS